MASPIFNFSALPPRSGGDEANSLFQLKRSRNGSELSSDLAALRMEDLDSRLHSNSPPVTPMSYASTLKNSVDRFRQTMTEEFDFTEDDYSYKNGKHGADIFFSEKVHSKLDYDWRCAVIVKLIGKPNATNAFNFMLGGLRRKWKLKGS